MREPDKFGQRQLWVCGFGPLFFLGGRRPQISGPFTEIRKENTKGMNLVLERVESPGSQAHSSRSGVAWSHAVGVSF